MTGASSQLSQRAERPFVSVVIPCVNGLPTVVDSVGSFINQDNPLPVEIIVPDRCGEETRTVLRSRFPQVQIISADKRATIPTLRALGIARARGRMLAITEDHCLAPPHWVSIVARACAEGHVAVGGPVENGSIERLVDWAVYFCEYARFMSPMPRGRVAEIPGNNSAFDRTVLDQVIPEMPGEVWESFWHDRMREAGVGFYSDPDMAVVHKKTFGYRYFLTQRYHYSRSFAGMRLRNAQWWKRIAYASATALLPILLLSRVVTTVVSKRRHCGKLLQCLPVLGTFLLSWAVGEAAGALTGPGQSLRRVE